MNIIDLTLPINNKTPTFPGDSKPEIKQVATIRVDGWNEKRISIGSHFSTPVDAPFHMLEEGKKLDEYQIEKFIGEAMVIDVKNKSNPNLDAIKKDDIVFFHTGHAKGMHSDNYSRQNPILSIETAQELIAKGIKIVGLDSFSPDNEPFEVHKLLLKSDILIVENLINLDKLIGVRFMCYILPLKITDADGAPCRVIGVLFSTRK